MAVAARAEDVPRIVSVEPGRSGELVVCRLVSVGLPGERISLSMRSGLVSSIELYLDLMDEGKKVVAGNRVSYRLAFDLWEEVYSLEEGGREHRFPDVDGLVQFLADLPRLPVAPLSTLTADGRFRVRAGLLMHPIAPSERERVEKVIGGDNRGGTLGDGQEMTISLGQLIRFFYKDGLGRPSPQSELLSGWFRLEDLSDATD
jgi:hypothetical protein